MTFLNSAGLLNMGTTDAVKTATSNTSSQDFQANQSDEFAQALRKQMQQANKPATNVAPPADTKSNPPAKEASKAQSSQESPKVKNDNGPHEQPEATASKSGEKKASEAGGDQNKTDQDKASTAEDTSAVTETPQDRKKRLLADLEMADPAAAGLTPWMQTMMAMRPVNGNSMVNDKPDAAEVTLDNDALFIDASAVTVTGEDIAEQASATNVKGPADVRPEAKAAGVAVDVRLPAGENANTAPATRTADFSETLGITKAIADAVAVAAGKATATAQAGNAEIPHDATNVVTLPAAQALPNSSWLNAAGVAQNANVYMSQIATPFGNERWQTAMNQHVLNMVGSGDDVASLTLSPPDLGPIQVVLKVDNQSVNTSFITDNPLVRQALQDGMQDLRERMQSQGLELGQTFVGNGQQANQHFEQQSANGNGNATGNAAETDIAEVTSTPVNTTVSRGLVDTFA